MISNAPLCSDVANRLARRAFLSQSGVGLGTIAASSLLADSTRASEPRSIVPLAPHFAPKAKQVISLFMHGGPSQLDLFDEKPDLASRRGEELPESVRLQRRLVVTRCQATW